MLHLALPTIMSSPGQNVPFRIFSLDDVSIFALDLTTLRKSLAIIPQDAFIFCGSVRDNLDPEGVHDDSDVWQALEKIGLVSLVREQGGLQSELRERGKGLSVGQRQLFCTLFCLLASVRHFHFLLPFHFFSVCPQAWPEPSCRRPR